MDDRIKIDVNGQMFAVPREIIENGPPSRLRRMYKAGSSVSKSECIVINRPLESFTAILGFYQTGEMHIPMTSCPGVFMRELEYWEVSMDVISDCCYNRLQSFLDEQDTLRQFKENSETRGLTDSPLESYSCLKKVRAATWEIVDYTKPSIVGKVYFGLTLLMVLLSIFTLAYSTDPSFQRAMTNCERLEYMRSSGMDGYEMVKPHLEELCDQDYLPHNSQNAVPNETVPESFELQADDNNATNSDYKVYLFKVLFQKFYKMDSKDKGHDKFEMARRNSANNVKPPDFEKKVENTFGNDMIYDSESENNTVEIDEYGYDDTLPDNFTSPFYDMTVLTTGVALDIPIPQLFIELKQVKVPDMKARLFMLVIMESVSNVFFTVDTFLRLYSCPRITYYFLSVINTADATALLGAYLHLFLYYKYPHLRYSNSWIDVLAYIQMLRSLRLFRIVSNIRAGKVLAFSARKNVKDLTILILFLIAGMCTFASCFYIAEDKTAVESIPDAWYWAIITMTTVGYGDIEPRTKVGRLIACICAIVGVLLLALTVPIFANHFLILYQHVETENVVKRLEKRLSGKDEDRKMETADAGYKPTDKQKKAFYIV
ncbi:potassium voltage-gated channel protein egl-36-like [Mercenaria mercenaria]|uniref:potassium voltage-gated channel protein egl-36-like n=1 Tax=Mercenaria mercenaria TaxID=6596 RepID=UPI00234FA463|nr:potassium voltage-gated channel protein egl-36-like [Mercenaria mercenaria]